MKLWIGAKRATPEERRSSRRGLLKMNTVAAILAALFLLYWVYRKNLANALLGLAVTLLYGIGALVAWWRVRRNENSRVELWGNKPTYRE